MSQSPITNDTESTQQSSKLVDDWISVPDNDFAADFFTVIGWDHAKPRPSNASLRLCRSCESRNPEKLFDPVLDLTDLKQRNSSCDICTLLQIAIERKGIKEHQLVALRQDTTHIGLENGPNLLTLYCEPGMKIPPVSHNMRIDTFIQIPLHLLLKVHHLVYLSFSNEHQLCFSAC